MKFLIDMPVSPELVKLLVQRGHQAVHVQDIGMSQSDDVEIVEQARKDSRIIVAADLDFGHLLALSNANGPGIVLFRGGNYAESEMRDLLTKVLDSVDPSIMPNAICVVDKRRVRVTRLPLR